MKKICIVCSLLFLSLSYKAQFGNLNFEKPQNMYTLQNESSTEGVAYENLITATKMTDLLSYYPSLWINKVEWVQLEIIDKEASKQQKASGTDFTNKQIDLLKNCKVGDLLQFKAGYITNNAVTNKPEKAVMSFRLKIVPYNEAKFKNGTLDFQKYVREQFVRNGVDNKLLDLKAMNLKFTVNEEGKITNTTILRSSGNADIDKKVTDCFNTLLPWQPATNKEGKKMSQNFVFSMGKFAGGC